MPKTVTVTAKLDKDQKTNEETRKVVMKFKDPMDASNFKHLLWTCAAGMRIPNGMDFINEMFREDPKDPTTIEIIPSNREKGIGTYQSRDDELTISFGNTPGAQNIATLRNIFCQILGITIADAELPDRDRIGFGSIYLNNTNLNPQIGNPETTIRNNFQPILDFETIFKNIFTNYNNLFFAPKNFTSLNFTAALREINDLLTIADMSYPNLFKEYGPEFAKIVNEAKRQNAKEPNKFDRHNALLETIQRKLQQGVGGVSPADSKESKETKESKDKLETKAGKDVASGPGSAGAGPGPAAGASLPAGLAAQPALKPPVAFGFKAHQAAAEEKAQKDIKDFKETKGIKEEMRTEPLVIYQTQDSDTKRKEDRIALKFPNEAARDYFEREFENAAERFGVKDFSKRKGDQAGFFSTSDTNPDNNILYIEPIMKGSMGVSTIKGALRIDFGKGTPGTNLQEYFLEKTTLGKALENTSPFNSFAVITQNDWKKDQNGHTNITVDIQVPKNLAKPKPPGGPS